MILIGDHSNKDLTEKIAKDLGLTPVYPDVHVFPDGEQRIRIIETELTGEDVFVVKSFIAPIDRNILEFCFLVDAIKRSGAKSITGIIPYLPYSRADHMFRTGEAVPLEVVIHMFEDSGLTRIVIVDPHSIKTPEVFKIPVINTSALETFAEIIKKIEPDSKSYTLVTPDMGGIRRIKILSGFLDGAEYASVEKDRDLETGSLGIAKIHGELKKTCFIVDDMISSGGTIVQAVDMLLEKGVEKVYVFATHPIFSEDASEKLSKSPFEKMYVTDALPVEKPFDKLEIVSVAPIITSKLKEA